jgi:hypothetical protein
MVRSQVRRIALSFASAWFAGCFLVVVCQGEPPSAENSPVTQKAATDSPDRQAKLEAALSKMLSGATLEGSFTSTGRGSDPSKLSREKYTLGEVKKLVGDVWQFPARIQYGGKDITLPIVLPIRWAGDTPVVTVDDLPLPGFGTVSARVMFFEGHYAGYWKHGDHGGNMFGVIHAAKDAANEKEKSPPIDIQDGNATPQKINR